MTKNATYEVKNLHRSLMATVIAITACSLLSLIPFQRSLAGETDPVYPYDEILVFMNVQGVGGVQVPAVISNEKAWFSITDVFDFVKIRNIPSPGLDSITGFFILPQATFLIDKPHRRILYQGKVFDLPGDALIRSTTGLYLRSDYFGQVFGLNCRFNFRSLSVILNTNLELPVIREIRQQAMRENLNRLRGETKADTSIMRSHPLFGFGMADWAAVATQNLQQGGLPEQNDLRMYLGLGGIVAGGETNLVLNYGSAIPFAEREQFYQWRYVDNDHSGLRQVVAGKIYTSSISSIYSPVVGIQFTNAPTKYRRSFGSYTLPYYAEANWVVELYVNNTLINYAKAEVAGYYTFKVPLVYGSSLVRLRFYSPWGEERSSEQNILIPFNFLPAHELEYTASAGMVEDSVNSRFSHVNLNYGLNKRLTVGGGIEYLSSVTTGKIMPFVNASLRLTDNLLVAGEYTYGVRSKFVASYHLPSDLQLEVDYTRYKEGQKAINNTFLEERKAILSFPFRSRKFAAFSRLTFYQIVLPSSSKYTMLEGLLSGVVWGVNTNFTTYALFDAPARPYVYSNFSMAFRLPGKLIFTPQAQYEYNSRKLIGTKEELGKYVNSHAYMNVYYENNFKGNFRSVGLSLRYDFSAVLTGFSVTRGSQTSTVVQSASGSMIYDNKTNYLGLTNRSSIGRGGIIVLPFLDLNGNGRRDKDEPKVAGLNIHMSAGRILADKSDTSIRVTELEAYASYILQLDPAFENISWRIRYKTISITIDPNQFKVVEVPVTIAGEVTGMVYIMENGSQKGQDRIIVEFYRSDSSLAGQSMTESDGSFDFAELRPGSYTAKISAVQMEKLQMRSLPLSLPFTISRSTNGDMVTGLKFIVEHR